MTAAPPLSPVDDLAGRLRQWLPVNGEQDALRAEYLEFISAAPAAALDRNGGPEHVTGSCFVFTADLERVLLCFHRKGQFWVQLGGHVEVADGSIAETALREAREECGIPDLAPLGAGIVDLDRHALSDAFTCSRHWDVGFAAVARADSVTAISAESEDVAWWPVRALPENIPPQFGRRLAGVLAELAQQLG